MSNGEKSQEEQSQEEQQSEQQKQQKQADNVVQIDASTYNALLDRLDELEGQASDRGVKTGDEIDDLYQEGTRDKGGGEHGKQEGQVNLDNLSNTELAHYVASELQNNALMPLLTKMADIELKLEVNSFRSSLKEDDYSDYEEDVLKVMYDNPKMSVKKAYLLVKAEKGDKPTKEGEGEGDSRNLLKHLPKRQVIHGEKPGAAAQGTEEPIPKDTKGAAKRAIKDLNIKFPVEDKDAV